MQKSYDFTDGHVSYKNYLITILWLCVKMVDIRCPSTSREFQPSFQLSAVQFTPGEVKRMRLAVLYSGVTCCEPFKASGQWYCSLEDVGG
jgi:hypothetical protein